MPLGRLVQRGGVAGESFVVSAAVLGEQRVICRSHTRTEFSVFHSGEIARVLCSWRHDTRLGELCNGADVDDVARCPSPIVECMYSCICYKQGGERISTCCHNK